MSDAPEFVYRIATQAEWAAMCDTGVAPGRDIDHRDGYMHLSTRAQILQTANLHFAGARDLLALEIPYGAIAEHVKFELAPKRGEKFPHLYGALKQAHVARAIRLLDGEEGFQLGEEV